MTAQKIKELCALGAIKEGAEMDFVNNEAGDYSPDSSPADGGMPIIKQGKKIIFP